MQSRSLISTLRVADEMNVEDLDGVFYSGGHGSNSMLPRI
jgi:putative intracellular protease/amidase